MLDTEHNAWFTEHTKPFWFYLQFPPHDGNLEPGGLCRPVAGTRPEEGRTAAAL